MTKNIPIEMKIALPFYKIAYAVFFIIVLSLARGVSYTMEIGLAIEAPMAILAAVFCADTYIQEIVSKRSEVQRLYPMRNRVRSIGIRMIIQEIFLMALAATGYGLFFLFQRPLKLGLTGTENELTQYLVYLAAMVVTLSFWGILSNTLACIFRNMWAGIGGALLLWLLTNSSFGENILGSFNVFSYALREAENSGDIRWLWGKAFCIVLSVMMLVIWPKILEKRG